MKLLALPRASHSYSHSPMHYALRYLGLATAYSPCTMLSTNHYFHQQFMFSMSKEGASIFRTIPHHHQVPSPGPLRPLRAMSGKSRLPVNFRPKNWQSPVLNLLIKKKPVPYPKNKQTVVVVHPAEHKVCGWIARVPVVAFSSPYREMFTKNARVRATIPFLRQGLHQGSNPRHFRSQRTHLVALHLHAARGDKTTIEQMMSQTICQITTTFVMPCDTCSHVP